MSEKLHFKVSAGLKNIIGKELINDKFIAIFELVKNSYDAGAKRVTIKFENIYGKCPQISIIDDGKGMSKDDIINKWLFVAYSEKKNNTYRDNIKSRRNYAGAKGVGRFSCDRLGEVVHLYSKTNNDIDTNFVKINWSDFEETDSQEFQEIEVDYDLTKEELLGESGTAIIISELREKWDRAELLQLKKSLTQLVNPEAGDNYDKFDIFLEVVEEKGKDDELIKRRMSLSENDKDKVYDKDIVNGKIVNHVFEILNVKTTKITARISEDGKTITTTFNDRGIQLFEIIEKNKYSLKNIKGTLYSLNRAAKYNFTKIMGIESVNYGSVFIYKNGFRVYPYGEPERDFMNIDRRKAQGYNRYFGTREITGRIDIYGENKGFIETSSRNNGFISSYETEELEDFFYDYLLKPLEKYVVNIIHWGEEIVDNESLANSMEDFDGLEAVLKKIKANFKTQSLLDSKYNEELTRIISAHSEKRKKTELEELKKIAREKADTELLRQAEKVEKETEKLKREVEESRKQVQEITESHEKTKNELETAQRQVGVLQSASETTDGAAIDAMHIMKAYADTIDSNIEEIMELVRDGEPIEEVIKILHEIRQTCSKIVNTYDLVINTEYRADTSSNELDIVKFTNTYVKTKWNHKLDIRVIGLESLILPFNPVEFSIIIDNLAENAKKANANWLEVEFICDETGKGINWRDDGYGLVSHANEKRIFEQGYTTTNGTGIGLFTVKKYVKKMKGSVHFNEAYQNGFEIQMRF
ncbi:MAG: ATP-binding protein [Agathobacter sp.]|nr:ATP-binding protein [Agathobacter sp.]